MIYAYVILNSDDKPIEIGNASARMLVPGVEAVRQVGQRVGVEYKVFITPMPPKLGSGNFWNVCL